MDNTKFDKMLDKYKAGELSPKQIKRLAEEIESDPEKRKFAIHGALAMKKPALAFHLLNRI